MTQRLRILLIVSVLAALTVVAWGAFAHRSSSPKAAPEVSPKPVPSELVGVNIPIPACSTAGTTLICGGTGTTPGWGTITPATLGTSGTGCAQWNGTNWVLVSCAGVSAPTGTGFWWNASGSLNSAAVSVNGDVSQGALSGGNVPLTVTHVQGQAVAAGTASGQVWQYNGTSWALVMSSTFGPTWANDLSTSSSTHQYLSSISGGSGTGGAVPLSAGAFLTAATSSASYIDLTAAGASYGYGKFLNYVEAPAFDSVSGALTFGATNATSISEGNATNTASWTANLKTGGSYTWKVNSTNALTLTNVQLNPGADNTSGMGTNVTRWASISTGPSGHFVYHNASDSAATTQIGDGAISFGPGGTTSPTVRWFYPSVSGELQLDNTSNGNATLLVGGTSGNQISVASATPTISVTGPAASGANPLNLHAAPQAPNSGSTTLAANTPGSFVVNVAAPGTNTVTGNEAGLVIQRNGVQVAQIGPDYSPYGTSYVGIWLGYNIVPTNSNWTFIGSASGAAYVSGVTELGLSVNNAQQVSVKTGQMTPISAGGASNGTAALYWSNVYANQYLFPAADSTANVTFAANGATNGNNLTVAAQNAVALGSSNGGTLYLMSGGANGGTGLNGNVVLGVGTNSHVWTPSSNGAVEVVDGNGLQAVIANYGAPSGGSTSSAAMWLDVSTPSTGNYSVRGDGTNLLLNAPTASVEFLAGNSAYANMNSSGQWGGAGTAAYAWQVCTVSISAYPTTLTAAQYSCPVIKLTGTLSANLTVVFPSTVGAIWHLWDQTSRGSFTVSAQVGSGSVVAVPTASLTAWPGAWVDVACFAANTTLIK